VKNAGETKWDYPERFGPWVADKFHRIVAGAIFLAPAALILPTAIPWWTSLVQKLPGILQAAAIPTFFIVVGLPFCIGGFLAGFYWRRFAPHNPRDHNAE
jgi:polyferredoxin